jgi:hypothetical protein
MRSPARRGPSRAPKAKTMSTKAPRKRADAKGNGAAKAHHTIVSLEVTGGFLRGCKVEFADGLNCVIGGRGTGKTTVLEFIRYALGAMPDAKTSPTRARGISNLIQGNLGNGIVRVRVRTKHGIEYVAERQGAEPPQVLDENGEPATISLDRDLIFKADVYSQNEIEEIALNPSHQLALIDKFIDEDVRRIAGELQRLDRELAQNANEIVRLGREAADLDDIASEAKVLEEKLKALQAVEDPDADVLNAAHTQKALREKERKLLVKLRSEIDATKLAFDGLAAQTARQLAGKVTADLLQGPNGDVLAIVSKRVADVIAVVDKSAERIAADCDAAVGILAEQETILTQRHGKQDVEYRALVEKSQEEMDRAAERASLEKRYLEVKEARATLEERQKERRVREEKRTRLMEQLSSLRDERFALRETVASRLTKLIGPTIRVSIMQTGNRDKYRALLTDGLKGTGMKYNVVADRIVESLSPEELADLVQQGETARLAERAGIDEDRARRVADALRNTELVFRLQTVELDDQPRIELLDGDYKDASDLSTGQRCTTILPILLLESERPLLIDQPEDNLDNKFIYETVVKSLKDAKGSRQLIFVTHNPNIPVLGDAERVFVMGSDGRCATVEHSGSVDDLKEQIETLLEGGKDAFLLRKERYGH